MKLIDLLKAGGYNPYRGPDGRFASGSSEYGTPVEGRGMTRMLHQWNDLDDSGED